MNLVTYESDDLPESQECEVVDRKSKSNNPKSIKHLKSFSNIRFVPHQFIWHNWDSTFGHRHNPTKCKYPTAVRPPLNETPATEFKLGSWDSVAAMHVNTKYHSAAVNNLDAACNVKKKKEKNISTLIRRWWSLQHTCHYRDTWLTSMQTTFQSCYPISTANVSAYIYTCVQVLRPNLSPNYNLWLSIYKSIF